MDRGVERRSELSWGGGFVPYCCSKWQAKVQWMQVWKQWGCEYIHAIAVFCPQSPLRLGIDCWWGGNEWTKKLGEIPRTFVIQNTLLPLPLPRFHHFFPQLSPNLNHSRWTDTVFSIAVAHNVGHCVSIIHRNRCHSSWTKYLWQSWLRVTVPSFPKASSC